MLEPDEGKLSRPVLRAGGGSNPASLTRRRLVFRLPVPAMSHILQLLSLPTEVAHLPFRQIPPAKLIVNHPYLGGVQSREAVLRAAPGLTWKGVSS